MNSEDTLHCSLCKTVEMGKCNRRKEEGDGEREKQATLRRGDVWLAFETRKVGGELRELLGRYTAVLLFFLCFCSFSFSFCTVGEGERRTRPQKANGNSFSETEVQP